jgi:hypothetical protein
MLEDGTLQTTDLPIWDSRSRVPSLINRQFN